MQLMKRVLLALRSLPMGNLRVIFALQSVQESHQVRLYVILWACVLEDLIFAALNSAVVFYDFSSICRRLTVGILLDVWLNRFLLLLIELLLFVLVDTFGYIVFDLIELFWLLLLQCLEALCRGLELLLIDGTATDRWCRFHRVVLIFHIDDVARQI